MSDQVFTQPIPGVASPTLHRIILFTERVARLTWPGQVAVVIGYTALVAVAWGLALESLESGSVIALVGLVFTLVDWAALILLPKRRRSYGPVAPGLVVFGGLRCGMSIVLALFAPDPIIASTLLLGGHLALTGYALDSMWGEPFRVGVTQLTYRSSKLDGAPPIRILHLTDFHIER
ncbi:MAG TPA: hypothetical protein VIK33_15630, partial [Anaerolineae bacterium]